ncbi:MAG: IS200/IS605 family transposase [Pirellulales bacterium]|nr:IS200/IS605 family transposase [Pirellulales bacterium]
MPQSLHALAVHIVFSTKCRRPFLHSKIRPGLWAFMAGILRNLECYAVHIGGVEDHVHIACNLTKKHAPMKVLEGVKKNSSKWLKTQSAEFRGFHWQDGYGLFSVSPSHVEALRKYIADQDEHHRRETFQDELMRILKKYAVEYDERYLWD